MRSVSSFLTMTSLKMSAAFRQFQGNPANFKSDDPRCKVFTIYRFSPDEHWLVNKWWDLKSARGSAMLMRNSSLARIPLCW